jgi:transposase
MPLEIGMAISITRDEHSADDLRRAAARAREAGAARRMLALALVMEGWSRSAAAESCGMDRQTLRDWVHRYNAEGLEGLYDRDHPGRPSRLTASQQEAVARIVEAGPDLAADGVVRWRCVDLQAVIQARFGVALAERTVGTLLNKLGYRRLSPRPYHPQKDAAAQETFKKTSPSWSPSGFRRAPKTSRSRSGSKTRPGSVSKEP